MFRAQARPGVVDAIGELDAASAPVFSEVAAAALGDCRGGVLAVDLCFCTFLDSAAIRALVDLRDRARTVGGDLHLLNVPPRAARLLDVLGLRDDFAVAGSGAAREGPAQVRVRAAEARAEAQRRTRENRALVDATCDTVAALSRDLAAAQDKIRNLEIALLTRQRIGEAVGIVMDRLKVTEDEAFDVLRLASQGTHRKLRELADQVVATGEIPAAA